MNKYWYSDGNIFKVKFRNHYCYKCGEKLTIAKHKKVVDQNSEEAKYYDFDTGGDGAIMVGPCEFIHKVFFCPNCSQNIEFVTQTNLEDIDILIKSIKNYFRKKGRQINIKKYFENVENEIVENCDIESIKNLYVLIKENDKETLYYKIPISRKKYWERPYYFNFDKKYIISIIQKYKHNGEC